MKDVTLEELFKASELLTVPAQPRCVCNYVADLKHFVMGPKGSKYIILTCGASHAKQIATVLNTKAYVLDTFNHAHRIA